MRGTQARLRALRGRLTNASGAGLSPFSEQLRAFDSDHVWHPYAPLPALTRALAVVGAEGVRLRLADGSELVDGMSSWWCAIHGYRHERLDAAVREQLGRMAHVMFGGITHPPAVELAAALTEMAPHGLDRVFFADSGSVAVEVAIKICMQYQQARGEQGRRRLLTVRGGYHGDTFGAMAVCDPVNGMHRLFAGVLPEHLFGARPPDGFERPLEASWEAELEALCEEHAHELAAVIVEPIVQGAGGMRFHSPACVEFLRTLCDRYGLLLVLDEIATGFGRTGALFACEHARVAPDVMCVGKALTGGYMSLAATLCTEAVARTVSAGEGQALMHGPTYMANPLACAVALASIELLANGDWRRQVPRIERALRDGLAPAREDPCVQDVRVLGAIGVVQVRGELDVARASEAAAERGVWLRPFRDLVYTMPAYVMEDEDVAAVSEAVLAAVSAGASRGAPLARDPA